MTVFLGILLTFGLLTIGLFIVRSYCTKPWLPDYVKWKISNIITSTSVPFPRHIMFLYVDHFEPWEYTTDIKIAQAHMENWLTNYPAMASKHRDADGMVPQHTWFYLVENWQWKEQDAEFLRQLGYLVYDGFGEVELHIHHGAPQRIFPEVNTSEKLQNLIEELKDFFSHAGALITAESVPNKPYGFIHGKWALDNAINGLYCGVDNELDVLARTGCYADFTMPSGIESQAKKINSIYYPTGNPQNPKSYNQGFDVKVGGQNNGSLMIFSGMIGIYYRSIFLGDSIIEKSNIDCNDIPTKFRIDHWIKCNIHVKDRPQWIFVKIHTHGAREENFNVSLGEYADQMFSYLEEKYNDGEQFKLHYVTAREAYNIVKAAEAGESGDPALFRDYLIKPYANGKVKSNVAYRLLSYSKDNFKIEVKNNCQDMISFDFKETLLKRIVGRSIDYLEYSNLKDASTILINLKGHGQVNFEISIQHVNDKSRIKVKNAKAVAKTDILNGLVYKIETQLESHDNKVITINF